jgi:hypothetical protein
MGNQTYKPEKTFWTEEDFARMGWHDNPVQAVAFGPGERELALDIDYIFKWEEPLAGEKQYRFWISPATLVFEDVLGLKISHDAYAGLTILGIDRKEPHTHDERAPKRLWDWTINCVEAIWEFRASGYRQFIRRSPELLSQQRLDYDQRGGYDFSCPKRCDS